MDIIEKYLKENPRRFCQEGIQRFRDTLGNEMQFTVRVTLGGDQPWAHRLPNGTFGFGVGSGVALEIERTLTNEAFGSHRFSSAKIVKVTD